MRFFQRVHRHDVAHLSKGVQKTLTIQYDMAGIVTDTLTVRWDIFNLVTKTLELIYSIPLVYVNNSLELLYEIRQPLFLKKNLGTFTATNSIDIGEMIA